MIHEVETSILKDIPDYSVILHQVNCQGFVQPGISQQLCRDYPGWYQDYHGFCKWFAGGHENEILGSFHRFPVQGKNLIICSAFAQAKGGKRPSSTDLDAWNKIIRKVFVQTKRVNKQLGVNWKIHIQQNIGSFDRDGSNEELMEMFTQQFGEDPDVQLWIHTK